MRESRPEAGRRSTRVQPVRRRLLTVPAALVAVVLAAGCTAAPSNDAAEDFSGPEQDVAEVIDELSAAAVDRDAQQICDTLFAAELADALGPEGADCEDAVEDQLADVTDAAIDVEDVTVTGDTATARVLTPFGEDDVEQTLRLVREGQTWRISGLEPAGS